MNEIKKDKNLQNKDYTINSFFNFIKCLSKFNKIAYEELLNSNSKIVSTFLRMTDILILNLLNKKENRNKKLKILNNIINGRNTIYIMKIFQNNIKEYKYKEFNNSTRILITLFFMAFNFNILNYVLELKNVNNIRKENKFFLKINIVLNNILYIFGKLYLDRNINDEYFELFLKYLIILSITKTNKKEPKEKDEIINFIFLYSCINWIKIVFKNLYDLQNGYTQKQEEIINNIILYINNNIIDYNDNPNRISYLNKVYLSKNDYKTTLLIDLYHIISKIKLKEVNNNYINLLANIYSFSFNYKNMMRPMVRLLEPLFINLNKKDIDQINEELNISDFSLSLLESLNEKETELLKNNSCLIKNGFYLGNDISGLSFNINSIENEIILFFSIRLESNDLNEITLFHIINNKDQVTQIKFCLRKISKNDVYQLYVEDKKEHKYTAKININYGKNYIFAISVKIEGLITYSINVKINYIKDDNLSNKKNDLYLKNGEEMKIKNFKNENLSIYFGCKIDFSKDNKRINRFRGFLGDIFIINSKNIKNSDNFNNDIDFIKLVLSLKRNYIDIITIFLDKDENIFIKKKNNDNKFIELKEKMKSLVENENKLFNTIILSDYFKLIKYQDQIDFMNIIKRNNNLDKESNETNIKKKYFDLKIKTDSSEDDKILKIYTSTFDKYFHIFQNELTLDEFIKYDGINYLSLLMEYYYQILNNIGGKKNHNKSEVKKICKTINQKIINNLEFLLKNIIQKEFDNNSINKYFYQVSITLLKFIEIDFLSKETIICLSNILNNLNTIGEKSDNIESIKINLIIFLLNPKLYSPKDEFYLSKLEYMLQTLLIIFQDNSAEENIFLYKISSIEILNKLLEFSWLMNDVDDINDSCSKSNIIIKNEEKKDNNYLLNTRKNYYGLLLEFLNSSYSNRINQINLRRSSQILDYDINDDNSFNLKYTKTIKEESEVLVINYFFDKALEYKKKNNLYIFIKMLEILSRTNYVALIDENRIDKIKLIILKELKNKDEKNKQLKSLVYISCLKILICFYFSNDKSCKEGAKNNEEYFHLFLRGINNIDFFYSLISLLNQIIYLLDNSSKNEEETINKKKFENINDVINVLEDKNFSSLNNLYFLNMNLKDLGKTHIHAIKSILEDIVFILFKNIIKRNDKEEKEIKKDELIYSNKNSDSDLEKEIFKILKKNIDIIFKYGNSKLYNVIFSSDSAICAELFYLIWKFYNINEGGENYSEKAIVKYHTNLLKEHSTPFIFKFYLYISNSNISCLENDNKNINKDKNINKTKIFLLNSIVNILSDFQKEINIKKDNYKYFINNLLNCLIILDKEIESNSNLFGNSNFYEIFYKYVTLLDKSCLFYTNYYIESSEKCGKIISEIIYDIFFSISEFTFNESYFKKFFIKDNKKEKNVYTSFYLIDICKEKNIIKELSESKESKIIKEELKKYIPNIDNLKYIYKYYFNKNAKIKLISNKKIYPIEDINFSVYFLAKSFIYLKKKEINGLFNEYLMEKFLPLLSKNIVRLFKKKNIFYGNRICKKFTLYSITKKFFEAYIIPNPQNFKSYKEFFDSDISVALKEENNISYCYSSRLIHDFKRKINDNKPIENVIINKEIIIGNEAMINNNLDNEIESLNETQTRETIQYNIFLKRSKTIESIKNIGNYSLALEIENHNLNIYQIYEKEKEIYNSFELIKSKNIIFSPKNYFFKIIFAEIYKNIMFNDKTFKLIRSIYLLQKREFRELNRDTKQINYPTIQKNFSNSLEPKIFLRRDFNFYDKKILSISHSYINNNLLNEYLDVIFLYPHIFNITEQKEELKFLECELVTIQCTYFGKIYFLENFIFFESSKEDPRDISDNLETFMKYAISGRTQYNKCLKQKTILIYNEDISEIIQRRTLLQNQSIEIFHKNGKSYFFNFFKTDNIKKAYDYLNIINQNLSKNNFPNFIFNTNNNEEDIKKITRMFHKGKISNYEYILYLNKYATRTYNDLTQYPVFPWIVKEHDKIPDIISLLSNKEISPNDQKYLRDMKYPITVQTEEKREQAKYKFLEEDTSSNFPHHLGTHYSTPAYIFYYLMRINPYGTNLIKLQNYHLEDKNRIFNSFSEIEVILSVGNDNREMIPDFFCYFDFLCNLNCCFYGVKSNKELIDDFKLLNKVSLNNYNMTSSYINLLFNNRRILNNHYISKTLSKWVDNIFGKKQFPEKSDEFLESYNIYNKLCYEQKVNFENKIMKNYEAFKNKKISEKKFKEKIINKMNYILNFGMNAKQILKDTIIYEGKQQTFDIIYKINKLIDEKYYYFNKIMDDNYLIIKKDKKNKNRVAIICDKNFKDKENYIYDFKSIKFLDNKKSSKDPKYENIQLYKINYSFSFLLIKNNESKILVFLTCRYLGNYFRLELKNIILNIFYEDFVTCIKERSLSKEGDNVFYTGLLNGKLTEWEIISYNDNLNPKQRKKSKSNYKIKVKELKYVYAHKSSITIIEIYNKQNIIITSGEDKYIYIRKIFDFELLTVINLIYSFGNPIISKACNIFPTLIKISELNLLYVLLYDYDSKNTIIRGYNLNGLFFAQTDHFYFKDQKIYLLFNNISFTKNSNLVVGFYNSNKFCVLSASTLVPFWIKDIITNREKNPKSGTKLVEYNYKDDEFYILCEREIIIMNFDDKNEKKEFDSF